jgi:four helix bundle protein
MKDFRQLGVWTKAHELTLAVYAATRGFPLEERYGVTRQLRGAAASVPTNIAEGCGRSQKDFARFLTIAMGSASEVEYLLVLSKDLGYLQAEGYESLDQRTREVKRMLYALLRRLQSPRMRTLSPP